MSRPRYPDLCAKLITADIRSHAQDYSIIDNKLLIVRLIDDTHVVTL
jgi:hypothetical protein